MKNLSEARVAILYPGDYETRKAATTENNRFANLFRQLLELGIEAVPAVYHPDFWEEVYQQVQNFDIVLVWVNPLQDGHDNRLILDAMLRKLADKGVFVSAHPDVILKMGTKEVLYESRNLGWGCETYLYPSLQDLKTQLPALLQAWKTRVLKQYRGNDGKGVWKVEAIDASLSDMPLRVRHAQRGSLPQEMPLSEFLAICEQYFRDGGKIIDQSYQERLPEGMIRCYMLAGFGLQAINALYPIPDASCPQDAPQPTTRLYYPPDLDGYQRLKDLLEKEWIPEFQKLLDIKRHELPIIWDADFLLGEKDSEGNDTYVLCEINVSSVAPYPESAVLPMAKAVIERIQAKA